MWPDGWNSPWLDERPNTIMAEWMDRYNGQMNE